MSSWRPCWRDHLSNAPISQLACGHLTHCHYYGLMDGLVSWDVSRLSQHPSDSVICWVRQGAECFWRVLSLDNCAYVVGTTQHTYASGQRRLSFRHSFVLPVLHDGKSSLIPSPLSFPCLSSLFLSVPFISFSFWLYISFSFPFLSYLVKSIKNGCWTYSVMKLYAHASLLSDWIYVCQ